MFPRWGEVHNTRRILTSSEALKNVPYCEDMRSFLSSNQLNIKDPTRENMRDNWDTQKIVNSQASTPGLPLLVN